MINSLSTYKPLSESPVIKGRPGAPSACTETEPDLWFAITSFVLAKASDRFLRRSPARQTKHDIAADVVDRRLAQDVRSVKLTSDF